MKYIDEYRDRQLANEYAEAIAAITTRAWTLMEICGGQTHSIVKHGIDRLIPSEISLIHGPGCPVCVTPIHLIDQAIINFIIVMNRYQFLKFFPRMFT